MALGDLQARTRMVDSGGFITRQWLVALQRLIENSASSGGSSSAPSSGIASTVVAATLSAASTTIYSGVTTFTDGQILAVELTQDSTGGRTITWGAEFAADTPTEISPRATAVTRFLFVCISGSFRCFAYFAQP